MTAWDLTVNARDLALRWHDVALAVAADDARVALTGVLVEYYLGRGVRLVATDTYSLLFAWLPLADADAPEPGLDEAPDDTLIAADTEGRMLALVRYLIGATKKDEYRTVTLSARLDAAGNQASLSPSLERRALIVDADVERIFLPEIEAVFPEWRRLYDGFKPAKTGVLAVGPKVMSVLGRLRAVDDGEAAVIEPGGDLRPARLTAGVVHGIFMPVRHGRNLDGEDES